MSALVRFLATKPRRVYLFPVVIEYKKNSHKKESSNNSLLFAPMVILYILSFFGNSLILKGKSILGIIIIIIFCKVCHFTKKNPFCFFWCGSEWGEKNQWKICEIFPWILHTKLTVVVPLSHAWTNEDYRQTDLCYIWILGTS